MKPSLYSLTSAVMTGLESCIDIETGEIDMQKFDQLQLDYKDKLIACAAVQKTATVRASGLEAQLAALTAPITEAITREKALAEKMRSWLASSMKATGTTRIESNDGLHSIRLYPDRDVSIEIDDGATFDASLCLPPKPPAPSKKLIKEAIERGEPIGGARIVRKDRLEIK